MKSRKEVVDFIHNELDTKKYEMFHIFGFGLMELRAVMDFIYEGEPENEDEYILKIKY